MKFLVWLASRRQQARCRRRTRNAGYDPGSFDAAGGWDSASWPACACAYVPLAEHRSQRSAVYLSLGTVALGLGILRHSSHELGVATLVVGTLACVLVGASLVAQRGLVRRPMRSPAEGDLIWHDTLLSWTVGPLAFQAALVGWVSGGIAVYATFEARNDLPRFLLGSAAALLVGGVWTVVRHVRAPEEPARPPYLRKRLVIGR